MLIEAQGGEKRAKYGDNLIKEYSIKLTKELNKKYSERNLMNMRKIYQIFKNEKVNAMRSQLTWSHYRELLSVKSLEEIHYYIELSTKNNLTYRELKEKIKSKEYERLSEDTKLKLSNNSKLEVQDLVKNPIIINNPTSKEILTEKALKLLILEGLDEFLLELGEGFTYIANEYKIKIGNNYNYISSLYIFFKKTND